MKAKRIGSALLALFLCVTLCLSLGACGKDDGGSKEDVTPTEAAESKIAEFIESAEEQLDSMRASFGDTMDMQLEARGSSMVYVFQYKEDTGMDNETMAAALDSALDAMSSTFTTILDALKTEVPEAESIIVEYKDKDGEVITSKEFK